jgi:magnesium/cobalt transport protein CorA
MRALAFSPEGPARPVAPEALPAEPGGEIWVDLDPGDPDPIAHGAGSWLGHLHPLTAAALRARERRHLALAQPGYVHVRLQVPEGADPADPAAVRPDRRAWTPAGGGPHAAAAPPPPAVPRAAAFDLVLGPGFALSVGARTTPGIARVWEAYARGRRRADSAEFAVYEALSAALAQHRRAVARLTADAEDIAERLVRISERHILGEIVAVRRRAQALHTLLAPCVDALGLLAAEAEAVRQPHRPYFADLEREAKELLASVQTARDTMTEAVEAYTSVQSTEMNRVMQIFTVVAVLFGPPTLIASIYGMNFRIPEYRWPFGYVWALGLMGAISATFYAWLRHRRWL